MEMENGVMQIVVMNWAVGIVVTVYLMLVNFYERKHR
jgi:hypothetical protein